MTERLYSPTDKLDESNPPKSNSYPAPGEVWRDTELFLGVLNNIREDCQAIMDSRGETTTEAKTNALSLQIAALGISILIRENNFWKEECDCATHCPICE